MSSHLAFIKIHIQGKLEIRQGQSSGESCIVMLTLWNLTSLALGYDATTYLAL